MSQDTSAALVGEAESTPSIDANPAGAHDQAQMQHEGEARREGGALPARTSMNLDPAQVQPSHPTSSPQQEPRHAAVDSGNVVRTGVAGSANDTPTSFSSFSILPADAVSPENHDTVAPPETITPQSPRDMLHSQALPSNTTTATSNLGSQSTSQNTTEPIPNEVNPPIHTLTDGAADAEGELKQDKMKTLQRRRNYANTNVLTDYEADLTSKDRAKQKEAVKRYLTERVKEDWKWEWPQPERPTKQLEPKPSPEHAEEVEAESDIPGGEWKERDEWLSNDDDGDDTMKVPAPANTISSHDTPTPKSKIGPTTPFRFGGPDGVGHSIKRSQEEKKRRRKERLAEELAWNDGMRCFVARRDNWTGARKKVPNFPSGFTPVKKTTTSASMSSEDGGSSTAIEQDQDDDDFWEDDIEVPIAPPILPPENAMRASILPGAYNTIYDKVVVQALSPSCPMNLKDVTRSCVQGWKRDGEWPPRSSVPETLKKKGRKMSVASLLGFNDRDKEKERAAAKEEGGQNGGSRDHGKDDKEKKGHGSALRKSLEKMLHLGGRGGN